MTTLRLGTRRSALATTQSSWVAARLRELGHEVELVEITTHGDTSREHLTAIGGTGVFAAAIRRALQAGEVDLAVHSLKDLPTAPEPGLVIAAVPVREDVRDALVARDGLTLAELSPGSLVGTGSPRRAAQLRALDLGLDVRPVRGNVDTRLGLVASGQYDAVVLARAGLARLGRLDAVTETLDPLQVLPAAGQGALAVECRADDAVLRAALAALDDPDTRAAVTAERALLAALEAGCTAPVGALAEVVEGEDGPELSLRAVVAAPDGSADLRRSLVGPLATSTPTSAGTLPGPAVGSPDALAAAVDLGRRLAAVLLEDGAAELAELAQSPAEAPAGGPVGTQRPPRPAQLPDGDPSGGAPRDVQPARPDQHPEHVT